MIRAHRRSHWYVFTVLIAITVFSAGHVRADAPLERYTASNGTVKDNKAGLLWQQNIDGGLYTWANAQKHCTALNLNGSGWRVPSMKELQTIVDESNTNPAIDAAFSQMQSDGFWTSSRWAADPSYAWIVFFLVGSTGYDGTTNTYRVRCVR